MFQRVRKFIAVGVLMAAPAATLVAPGVAHAATITWTGGGSDGNWSTSANWAGGVVPSSGDSVVIDNAANFSHGSRDDIVGLSLAGITFTNNASSHLVSITFVQNLTLTGPVTQAPSDTNTTNTLDSASNAKTLTLGADVAVTVTAGIGLGDTGDTLALGSHTLTLTDSGSGSPIVAIDADITGTGGIVYNGAATHYQLGGDNTYSGPTHVIATGLPVTNTADNNMFGTSAITIENAGAVHFSFNTNTTINNPITVSGTTNGSPVTSLGFDDGGASNVVLTVPNLTLNGDTRFANDGTGTPPLVVNLAGITANNHCIEYLGYGGTNTDGPSNGFQNGPAGCNVDASFDNNPDAPGTPDTGFALVSSHPMTTLAVTVLSALLIFGVARSTRRAGSHK